MKKIAFFVHFDQHNIVDPYIEYFLTALNKAVDEIVIISNSQLNETHRQKLLYFTPHVIIRDNKEVDYGAWRDGLNKYGWSNLNNFDQLLLINDSCYGPIGGSFSPLFDIMDKQPHDFWGVTFNSDYIWHLQSYFLAFNKNVFSSKIFKKFMARYHGKTSESIIKNRECKLTYVLNRQGGFSYTSYSSMLNICDKLIKKGKNISYLSPYYLLEHGNILLKKKMFSKSEISPESTHAAINYIKQKDPTLEKLILNNIRRTAPPNSQIHSLTKLLVPSKDKIDLLQIPSYKIAVHLHLSGQKIKEKVSHYLLSIPFKFDLLITLTRIIDSVEIKNYFQSQDQLNLNEIIIKTIPNRGQNISALTIPFSQSIKNYDLVCHIHTIKIDQSDEEELRLDYLLTNLLGDKKTVTNILHSFSKNENLGFLYPAIRTTKFFHHFNTWKQSNKKYYKLRHILIDEHYILPEEDDNYSPLVPYDAMFWFRPKALAPIFNKFFNFKYDSFIKGSEGIDTLSEGIKRLLIPICLSQGYDFRCILQEDHLIKNYLNFDKHIEDNLFVPHGVKHAIKLLLRAIKMSIIFRSNKLWNKIIYLMKYKKYDHKNDL